MPSRTAGAAAAGFLVGGTAVAVGGKAVFVGGTGVLVGGNGVAVGGTGVLVGGTGVADGGTGVLVGGTGVAVGGTGVFVGGNGVAVGGTGVFVGGMGVADGGMGVGSGVGVGDAQAARTSINRTRQIARVNMVWFLDNGARMSQCMRLICDIRARMNVYDSACLKQYQ